jgi:phosphohistidine phosphatase
MKLFLVRHGEAHTKEVDPNRSLTDAGIEMVRKVARFAKKHLNIKIVGLFHSEKMRARQTAEIFGEFFQFETGIRKSIGLNPMDDPTIWVKKLENLEENIMIVGHLPHLGKLIELLMAKNEDQKEIYFHTGSLVCLEKYPEEKWVVEYEISSNSL